MRLLKTPLFDANAVKYASDDNSDAASVATNSNRQQNVSPQARKLIFDLGPTPSASPSEEDSESESENEPVASTESSSQSEKELSSETVWSAEWTPELVEFSGREIPEHAILSHTLGAG
ncbi:hypothetical protein CERZMDRAFT_96410 [Cercospora zeae-maydis SCOH1-5]|uniref:Uncharacterized protein n=1 Tax=Cercospora zeae-maydis SCOH1-5 TaxID=717836 RepID=A0A6A6FK13_9PEZI|nr:hypothetical protein CERZMDRAFT_96410 [Cercospora zeae-maydis SCOH1-5]